MLTCDPTPPTIFQKNLQMIVFAVFSKHIGELIAPLFIFVRIEYGINGLGKGRQEMESILARYSP